MRRAMIAVLVLAGCDAGDGPPDLGPPEQLVFDLGIEVSADRVHVRQLYADPLCEPQEFFPALDECTSYTDAFGCMGVPTTCFTRVAVERDGVTLGEAVDLVDTITGIYIQAPGLFDASGATLVLDGCEATHSLPLPSAPAPAPTVLDLTTDGSSLYFEHTIDPSATGVFGMLGYGFTADACHVASTGPGRVPLPSYPAVADLHAAGVIDAGTFTTPWGDAQIWNVHYGVSVDGVLALRPTQPGGDTWELRMDQVAEIEIVDNGISDPILGSGTWRFTSGPDGLRHELELAAQFRYTAGATTDTLRLIRDGAYSATIPHVVPVNELDFAFAGDDRFELVIGPVDLALETDPSVTRTTTISLRWRHPRLVRPE